MNWENGSKSFSKEKPDVDIEGYADGKLETSVAKENIESGDGDSESINGKGETKEEGEEAVDKERNVEVDHKCLPPSTDRKPDDPGKEVENDGARADSSGSMDEVDKEEKGIDSEIKAEDIDLDNSNMEVATENRINDVTLTLINDKVTLNTEDEGKSLAVCPPSEANSPKKGRWLERDLLSCREDVMEGPSSRGFELFFSPVTRTERTDSSLFRSNSQRELEQLVMGGAGFVEKIVTMIVSEPIQVMASRIQEMTDQSLAYLKKSTHEMIIHEEKRAQLNLLQKAVQHRTDFTLESLLKSHQVQLEILAALKTGIPDFLQQSTNIPSSDLAEILMNTKCRNPACRSPIPVDECDCKVCLQKNGFCSNCMCLLCSKFDMASNTCSWVGCDVCLHWCHADCGLRQSFIRNGRSVTGGNEATEMQFHCVACDHPSEMFGFVKEVIQTCAKEWKAETFSKELEYVKRIFAASKDMRGRTLHDIATHMLPRLEMKSSLPEVYNLVMGFLAESDKIPNGSSFSAKELPRKFPGEGSSNGGIGLVQDTKWLASASTEKASPRVEGCRKNHPSLDWDQVVARHHQELQLNAEKMPPVVDELESIVRIKRAEAKMFQERADDAKREAEGLKRIAVAKNEKIEEEYMKRITKLRLGEAQERRKQKLEELEVIEKSHQEYFSMKTRMEADIKDLLLKMEATSRNFNT